jgi:hypothetical protein
MDFTLALIYSHVKLQKLGVPKDLTFNMIELTKQLIPLIIDGDSEAILGAEEIAMFLVFGIENTGIVEPYLSEISNNPPTTEDGAALQKALVEHLRKYEYSANPAAIWALGKYQNTAHVELLREQLAVHLEQMLKHSSAVYNAIESLNKCGEDASRRASSGTMEVENNIEDARNYLAKFGKVFPW